MEKRKKKKKRLTGLIHGYNFKIITIYYWPFCLRKEENRLVVERMGSDGLRPWTRSFWVLRANSSFEECAEELANNEQNHKNLWKVLTGSPNVRITEKCLINHRQRKPRFWWESERFIWVTNKNLFCLKLFSQLPHGHLLWFVSFLFDCCSLTPLSLPFP